MGHNVDKPEVIALRDTLLEALNEKEYLPRNITPEYVVDALAAVMVTIMQRTWPNLVQASERQIGTVDTKTADHGTELRVIMCKAPSGVPWGSIGDPDEPFELTKLKNQEASKPPLPAGYSYWSDIKDKKEVAAPLLDLGLEVPAKKDE